MHALCPYKRLVLKKYSNYFCCSEIDNIKFCECSLFFVVLTVFPIFFPSFPETFCFYCTRHCGIWYQTCKIRPIEGSENLIVFCVFVLKSSCSKNWDFSWKNRQKIFQKRFCHPQDTETNPRKFCFWRVFLTSIEATGKFYPVHD